MPQQRIKVRGIRREAVDTQLLSQAIWLIAKRRVQDKRDREARERARREEIADER